jgi:ATP-dependent DNA helicase RecG
MVWGIEDESHRCVGTAFDPTRVKEGNEALENWLLQLLSPRIDFTFYESVFQDHRVVYAKIQAANSTPVRFGGEEYLRVGSYKKKLREFPEKERQLWALLSGTDWSAQVVEEASLEDLDPRALEFGRQQYAEKFPAHAQEMQSWDNLTFLNKAKLSVSGKLTKTALLLLGKPLADNFLSPADAKITWVLKDENNVERDYLHIGLPFLLAGDEVLKKVRNLKIRHLPSGTLFPEEMDQYDTWVLRETLHNCIAHQDYSLGGRISVVEFPHSLLFSNKGDFIPGSVERMIEAEAPPEFYRNRFLVQAMVNLNMIDTIGSGIKRMFRLQKERSFPMPDFDLQEPGVVRVKIYGQILDASYTNLLLRQTDLDLRDAIALDKVQKKLPIDKATFQRLKSRRLLEGRWPKPYVSARIAAATGEKAAYIKNRAFEKQHYKQLVLEYLRKFGVARRSDIDQLLLEKLPDILEPKQKKGFVNNLLQEMRREGSVATAGTTRWATWRLP